MTTWHTVNRKAAIWRDCSTDYRLSGHVWMCIYIIIKIKHKLPSDNGWPATDLHLHVCVREVVLWRQFPIIVDEVVKNRRAEHWLKKHKKACCSLTIIYFYPFWLFKYSRLMTCLQSQQMENKLSLIHNTLFSPVYPRRWLSPVWWRNQCLCSGFLLFPWSPESVLWIHKPCARKSTPMTRHDLHHLSKMNEMNEMFWEP